MKSVIVFGSINRDLVIRTPRLPTAGETLQGSEFFTAAGGKGANQAVAASRLGNAVSLVGRVGNDDFGQRLLGDLHTAGVQTDGILVDEAVSSGVAVITVDDTGENTINIVAGANGRLDEVDVGRLRHRLPNAAILLLQLEVPLAAVQLAAAAAKQANVPVILDPAPAQPLPAELYPLIEIITPNQGEASQLVGFPVDGQEAAAQAAGVLRQRGVGTVIVKLGAQGVFCATAEAAFFVPAFSVQTVDTVAAGDAFNGGLAAALVQGLPLRQAVVWGAAAGALCAMTPGAQSAMPEWDTFEAFLRERGFQLKIKN